jgi:hypothetical protein
MEQVESRPLDLVTTNTLYHRGFKDSSGQRLGPFEGCFHKGSPLVWKNRIGIEDSSAQRFGSFQRVSFLLRTISLRKRSTSRLEQRVSVLREGILFTFWIEIQVEIGEKLF